MLYFFFDHVAGTSYYYYTTLYFWWPVRSCHLLLRRTHKQTKIVVITVEHVVVRTNGVFFLQRHVFLKLYLSQQQLCHAAATSRKQRRSVICKKGRTQTWRKRRSPERFGDVFVISLNKIYSIDLYNICVTISRDVTNRSNDTRTQRWKCSDRTSHGTVRMSKTN